jgi:hypothetical protein
MPAALMIGHHLAISVVEASMARRNPLCGAPFGRRIAINGSKEA